MTMPAVGAPSTTLPVRHGIGFDGDAVAALVDGLVLAAEQVAHEVALHDGEASAVVEVGDRDAGRRGVDEVVGDQRAFETELGVDGDLAEARARIGDRSGCRTMRCRARR